MKTDLPAMDIGLRISRRGVAAIVMILALVASPGPFGRDNAAYAQAEGRAVEEPSPLVGNVPGQALGNTSDAAIWRAVRGGVEGSVSIPDKQAGVMIQSEGDNWRAWRNGPLTVGGGWILLGMVGVLALFFALRGRIRIEAGAAGRTVERFNGIERFTHWLTAVSFILLGLTGLNLLYGKHAILPAIGPDAFAAVTLAGKYVHNFVAFPFMLGVAMMFVLWVGHNMPNRHDLVWLAKLGGMFVKGVHPPSRKFNAGQKLIFWAVVLGGLSLALSGIALMFPFEFAMFSATFKLLNVFGLELPANLAPIQEMQLSQLWHGIVGLVMIAIIIAHIYIGSLGMEGAFDAMGTGRVDENWAREHHNLWAAELTGEPATHHG